MKYQVQTKKENGKEYYLSYIKSEDSTLGDMSCDTLPPYQDIKEARSCYWDADKWVFDSEKYQEKEKEAERIASIPSNEELYTMILDTMDALCELAQIQDTSTAPLAKLASMLKG